MLTSTLARSTTHHTTGKLKTQIHSLGANPSANIGALLREIGDSLRAQGETFTKLADAISATSSTTTAQGTGSLRAQLWTLAADERLSTRQVAEACGKSTGWVHKHIDAKRTDSPLPYRHEQAGSRRRLVFIAGEVRAWLEQREVVIRPGVLTAALSIRAAQEPRHRKRILAG